MKFENELAIGNGIYTVPDISRILRLPYYKVNISDPQLVKEFGMIHNFKEVIKNGWVVLEPAIDPQGRYHAYLWTCLMTSIYILLLNDNQVEKPD